MNIFDRLKDVVRAVRGGRAPSIIEAPPAPTVQLARVPGEPPRPGRAMGPLPIYQQLQRIGGSLTPIQVSEVMRQADTGYMWRYIDLLNEARQKDCHLQSVLQTRELALTGLEWQVLPFKARSSKKALLRDQKAANFCADALQAAPNLHRLIAHTAGAAYYGYAVTETTWTKDGTSIVPCGFKCQSPRRFMFDMVEGKLRWCDINAGMALPGVDLTETYPGQFVQYQPRINGDVDCREGLGRVLMWAALFRNWTERDWMALAELAWKPWRTGKYKKNADELAEDKDITNLTAILEQMTASGVAVYPDTTEVDIQWPQGSTKGTSNHKELFDTLGSEMSKAVLGQTLTTEQGNKGTQALGTVHDLVRKDILIADAKSIGEVLKRDLLTPLVRMNFGADVQIPDFVFITEDAADVVSFSTAIKNLAGDGSPKIPIPVSHVYEVCGIPQPEPGEATVGGVGQVFNGFGQIPDDAVADQAAQQAADAADAADAKDEKPSEDKPKKSRAKQLPLDGIDP